MQSAQSVLAEAIASGAAEKLLSGILSPNQSQGFSPQNAVSFSVKILQKDHKSTNFSNTVSTLTVLHNSKGHRVLTCLKLGEKVL